MSNMSNCLHIASWIKGPCSGNGKCELVDGKFGCICEEGWGSAESLIPLENVDCDQPIFVYKYTYVIVFVVSFTASVLLLCSCKNSEGLFTWRTLREVVCGADALTVGFFRSIRDVDVLIAISSLSVHHLYRAFNIEAFAGKDIFSNITLSTGVAFGLASIIDSLAGSVIILLNESAFRNRDNRNRNLIILASWWVRQITCFGTLLLYFVATTVLTVYPEYWYGINCSASVWYIVLHLGISVGVHISFGKLLKSVKNIRKYDLGVTHSTSKNFSSSVSGNLSSDFSTPGNASQHENPVNRKHISKTSSGCPEEQYGSVKHQVIHEMESHQSRFDATAQPTLIGSGNQDARVLAKKLQTKKRELLIYCFVLIQSQVLNLTWTLMMRYNTVFIQIVTLIVSLQTINETMSILRQRRNKVYTSRNDESSVAPFSSGHRSIESDVMTNS